MPRDITHVVDPLISEIHQLTDSLNIDTTNNNLYSFQLSSSQPHACAMLRSAKRALNKAKREAISNRQDHLARRQLHHSDHGNANAATTIKHILASETRRRIFRTIKAYVNPRQDGNHELP